MFEEIWPAGHRCWSCSADPRCPFARRLSKYGVTGFTYETNIAKIEAAAASFGADGPHWKRTINSGFRAVGSEPVVHMLQIWEGSEQLAGQVRYTLDKRAPLDKGWRARRGAHIHANRQSKVDRCLDKDISRSPHPTIGILTDSVHEKRPAISCRPFEFRLD